MIESIQFENFKAIRSATLPLGPVTLIVGPNGSGKSTALQAFEAVHSPANFAPERTINAAEMQKTESIARVVVRRGNGAEMTALWQSRRDSGGYSGSDSPNLPAIDRLILERIQVYSLDAKRIAEPSRILPNVTLPQDGAGLAGSLDVIRDQEPERFEELNEQLGQWLPEFDRILFENPQADHRGILLRTRAGHYKIPASQLSHGTLFALAILTIAYLPEPPPLIGLEEPDHGLHPRLLRRVQDAIYRLAHPGDFGEEREPVQVVATTHSPYFLDLFKDHPEEVVIAHKDDEGVHFDRLSDRKDISKILADAPLGEIWYSGILGGVPADS